MLGLLRADKAQDAVGVLIHVLRIIARHGLQLRPAERQNPLLARQQAGQRLVRIGPVDGFIQRLFAASVVQQPGAVGEAVPLTVDEALIALLRAHRRRRFDLQHVPVDAAVEFVDQLLLQVGVADLIVFDHDAAESLFLLAVNESLSVLIKPFAVDIGRPEHVCRGQEGFFCLQDKVRQLLRVFAENLDVHHR